MISGVRNNFPPPWRPLQAPHDHIHVCTGGGGGDAGQAACAWVALEKWCLLEWALRRGISPLPFKRWAVDSQHSTQPDKKWPLKQLTSYANTRWDIQCACSHTHTGKLRVWTCTCRHRYAQVIWNTYRMILFSKRTRGLVVFDHSSILNTASRVFQSGA